jgi:hypothetical protein
MSNGQLGDSIYENIPFKLNVSQGRRKKLLEAIIEVDNEKRIKGQKIL